MKPNHFVLATAGLISLAIGAARSDAGTFANIAIDGTFTDWSGVPVLLSDPSDSTKIDIANVQIANDAANLYLRVTYHTAVNPNTGPSLFLAFDADNNTATAPNSCLTLDFTETPQVDSEAILRFAGAMRVAESAREVTVTQP